MKDEKHIQVEPPMAKTRPDRSALYLALSIIIPVAIMLLGLYVYKSATVEEVPEVEFTPTIETTGATEERTANDFTQYIGLYFDLDTFDTRPVACQNCTFVDIVFMLNGEVHTMEYDEFTRRLTQEEDAEIAN